MLNFGGQATGYPDKSIDAFFTSLPFQLANLLNSLLDFFSRLIAHHPSSRLTPSHLAALFGPLIFGLDPSATSVGVGGLVDTHKAYVREVAATRHLILAWIRKQEALHDRLTGDYPRTLGEWIVDYPHRLSEPPQGSQIRVTLIRRVVRSYSPDLMTSHREWVDASWAPWRAVGEPRMTQRHATRLGLRGAEQALGGFGDFGFTEGQLADRLRFDLGERAKAVHISLPPSFNTAITDIETAMIDSEKPARDVTLDRLCIPRGRIRPVPASVARIPRARPSRHRPPPRPMAGRTRRAPWTARRGAQEVTGVRMGRGKG